MKITKTQLRQIIEEEINALAEEEEGEGYMAVSQLEYMKEIIPKIQQYVNDASDLEEWVESKITKAQDYLSSDLNYMRGEDLVDAGDAAREMKAVAAVVNRGPLQEADEAEMIEKLEDAIDNARELVANLPADQKVDAAKVLNRLETRYNQIMKGRG